MPAKSKRSVEHVERQKEVKVTELPLRRSEQHVSFYCNHAEIGNSPWDVYIQLFEITHDEEGNAVREERARVTMSPQHAAAFSQVLRRNLERWVQEYGPATDAKDGR